MTKSHNSCKTCNFAKSNLYGHLHVMLVTVYGYEQNPSRGVGGVAHTSFAGCTYGQTCRRMYGEVQILMPTHNFVGGIKVTNKPGMSTSFTLSPLLQGQQDNYKTMWQGYCFILHLLNNTLNIALLYFKIWLHKVTTSNHWNQEVNARTRLLLL